MCKLTIAQSVISAIGMNTRQSLQLSKCTMQETKLSKQNVYLRHMYSVLAREMDEQAVLNAHLQIAWSCAGRLPTCKLIATALLATTLVSRIMGSNANFHRFPLYAIITPKIEAKSFANRCFKSCRTINRRLSGTWMMLAWMLDIRMKLFRKSFVHRIRWYRWTQTPLFNTVQKRRYMPVHELDHKFQMQDAIFFLIEGTAKLSHDSLMIALPLS